MAIAQPLTMSDGHADAAIAESVDKRPTEDANQEVRQRDGEAGQTGLGGASGRLQNEPGKSHDGELVSNEGDTVGAQERIE